MQINKLRLPKAFTLKWIEALRSGKYTQGNEYLCEEHKVDENTMECHHCCLGVAVELLEKIPYPIMDINLVGEDEFDEMEVEGWIHSGYPKELIDFRDELGISNAIPTLFAGLNDGTNITYLKSKYAERLFPDAIPEYLLSRVDSTGGIKLSFEEIADFIEQEFELYD